MNRRMHMALMRFETRLRAGDRTLDAPFLVDVKEKGHRSKRLFALIAGATLHTILVLTDTGRGSNCWEI